MDVPMTFDSLLAARLAMPDPRPVMVEADGSEISPRDFERMTGQAAAWLSARGLGAGDRIAVWLHNRPEWLAILFGAARLGIVVAAVNSRYRTAELHHILASSRARLLVLEPGDERSDFPGMAASLDRGDLPELAAFAMVGGEAPGEIGGLPVHPFDPESHVPLPPGSAAPDDAAMLFTTSGTTSKPKLVLHRQASLIRHAFATARAYGLSDDGARYLAAMPFCGVFGLNPTFAAIAGSAPVHVLRSFEVGPAIEVARTYRITHFFGSDEMFRQMWDTDPAALEAARLCGFASFTPGVGGLLREMAGAGLPLAGLYGASEVNAIFAVQPLGSDIGERLKGGGRPAGPDAEVRVRDPETGALCAVGETGILEIRAETNFACYDGNPEATGRAIDAEGFFSTGDVGYLRGDGTFVYLARGGDFIRLSGFLTDPAEIEEVIEQAGGVGKAQVVGVPHEGRTRPVAFVVPREGGAPPDPEAIIAQVRARLAHYKVPLMVVPLDAFPTTQSANGMKIRKSDLREMASARLAEDAP